jgi:MSHA pilin protein MshA
MPIKYRGSKGFTLIELVIVIIILGILSVVAIPKFISLSADSELAATQGIAGALSSANAENYAARIERSTNGVPVTNCNSLANALLNGLPAGYTIVSQTVGVNVTVTCTLNGPSSATSTFVATGIL